MKNFDNQGNVLSFVITEKKTSNFVSACPTWRSAVSAISILGMFHPEIEYDIIPNI